MPFTPKDELAYRRLQRQLGEIQVSLKLANSILKDNPRVRGLQMGVEGLLSAKADLFQKIKQMEAEA